MAKKAIFFSQTCRGCDGAYTHWENYKLYSGGCIKSLGNSYCIKGKKHFKLSKRNLNLLRPPNCPISQESPVTYEET